MAVYIIVRHEDALERIRVSTKPVIIGRSSRCTLTLLDPLISGQHLSIFIGSDGRALIKDLESTNGVYLNGAQVQDTALYLDDMIQFGNVSLCLCPNDMTEREKAKHKKDYEKTHVTFVDMGPDLNNGIDVAGKPKKTLLGEIRKKKLNQAVEKGEVIQSKIAKKQDDNPIQIESVKKTTKKKTVIKGEKEPGVKTQIKKLFKL